MSNNFQWNLEQSNKGAVNFNDWYRGGRIFEIHGLAIFTIFNYI